MGNSFTIKRTEDCRAINTYEYVIDQRDVNEINNDIFSHITKDCTFIPLTLEDIEYIYSGIGSDRDLEHEKINMTYPNDVTYSLDLVQYIRDWFDDCIWNSLTGTEFCDTYDICDEVKENNYGIVSGV